MSPRRGFGPYVAAAAVVVALAGCGDDDPGDEPTSTASTSEGLTSPGARLDLGETARVDRTSGDGVFDLTIEAIEKGNAGDLAGVYEKAEPVTPYYVRYDIELVSGSGDGILMTDYLSAWAAGAQVAELVVPRPFAPCQVADFPKDAPPGLDVESCRIYLVADGAAPVDSIRFANDDDYGNGDGSHLEWR